MLQVRPAQTFLSSAIEPVGTCHRPQHAPAHTSNGCELATFFLAYTVWLLSPCAVSRIPLCCNRLHLRAQQEAPLEGPAPGGLTARQRISKHDWGDGAAGMEPAYLQLLLAPWELISEVSVGSRTTIIRLQRDVAGCCTSGEGWTSILSGPSSLLFWSSSSSRAVWSARGGFTDGGTRASANDGAQQIMRRTARSTLTLAQL